MATEDVPWFRVLHDEILAYQRHSLFHDVLMPWSIAGSDASLLHANQTTTYGTLTIVLRTPLVRNVMSMRLAEMQPRTTLAVELQPRQHVG